jgi:hypothetical protein
MKKKHEKILEVILSNNNMSKDVKGFIKTWWHCLWRMTKGHRMCKYTYPDGKILHACDCGYNDLN